MSPVAALRNIWRNTFRRDASQGRTEGADEATTESSNGSIPFERNTSVPGSNSSRHDGHVEGSESSERRIFRKPRIFNQIFGDNVLVHGGEFIIGNKTVNISQHSERVGFKRLQEHVAPTAFHNSAQRVDPPRCHPKTRVEILQRMYDWIIQSENRETWLMWLNGAAGAGKSAIMQTQAERCFLNHIAIASFFLSRNDTTRNSLASLVATLVYQLIQQIPEITDTILQSIERNPFIFDQTLEYQLHELVIQPLLQLPRQFRKQFIIFIDGLDECLNRTHQSNLIKVIGSFSSFDSLPIIFIIASRREAQIVSAFSADDVENLVEIVPLDESEASDDIRRFLNDGFAKIHRSHIQRRYLPFNWPSISMISDIVDKASGQFIFASVVMNFVSSDRNNPVAQLKVIRDLRLQDPSSEHPFAHLDSLYQYIFSQVKHLDKVLDIIALNLFTSISWVERLEGIFLLESGNLEVLLVDLLPLLQFKLKENDVPRLQFLHASLPDFLQDPLRSQEYFLDLDKYHTKLLCMFLERPLADPLFPKDNWTNITQQEHWRLGAIERLLQRAKASDQLQNAIMNFNSRFHCITIDKEIVNAFNRGEILDLLKRLEFGDQGQAYYHVLDMFAEEQGKFWPFYDNFVKNEVRQFPDFCARIEQLHPKLAQQPSLDLSEDGKEFWTKRHGWKSCTISRLHLLRIHRISSSLRSRTTLEPEIM